MKKIIFLLLLLCSSVNGQTYSQFGNTATETVDITLSTADTYLLILSAYKYTATAGDIIDSIVVYVSTSSSNDSVAVGVYDLSDSSLVAYDTIPVAGATGWVQEAVTVDGSRTWELTGGNEYAVAISIVTNTVLKRSFIPSGSKRAASSVFPDPWSSTSNDNYEYSVYVVYHNDPGGVTKFHKHSEEGNGVLHSSNGSSPRHKSE